MLQWFTDKHTELTEQNLTQQPYDVPSRPCIYTIHVMHYNSISITLSEKYSVRTQSHRSCFGLTVHTDGHHHQAMLHAIYVVEHLAHLRHMDHMAHRPLSLIL